MGLLRCREITLKRIIVLLIHLGTPESCWDIKFAIDYERIDCSKLEVKLLSWQIPLNKIYYAGEDQRSSQRA